jgi:hypothetical protein
MKRTGAAEVGLLHGESPLTLPHANRSLAAFRGGSHAQLEPVI